MLLCAIQGFNGLMTALGRVHTEAKYLTVTNIPCTFSSHQMRYMLNILREVVKVPPYPEHLDQPFILLHNEPLVPADNTVTTQKEKPITADALDAAGMPLSDAVCAPLLLPCYSRESPHPDSSLCLPLQPFSPQVREALQTEAVAEEAEADAAENIAVLRKKLHELSVGDECFALGSFMGDQWFKARILSTRERAPQVQVKYLATADGNTSSLLLPTPLTTFVKIQDVYRELNDCPRTAETPPMVSIALSHQPEVCMPALPIPDPTVLFTRQTSSRTSSGGTRCSRSSRIRRAPTRRRLATRGSPGVDPPAHSSGTRPTVGARPRSATVNTQGRAVAHRKARNGMTRLESSKTKKKTLVSSASDRVTKNSSWRALRWRALRWRALRWRIKRVVRSAFSARAWVKFGVRCDFE